MNTVEEILELARWAPSGDNTQPWRFEVVSDQHIVVHAFDTREHCVYDLQGRASQLSVGAMLETLRIAASLHGLEAQIQRRAEDHAERPVFDVRLQPGAAADPLHAAIRQRSVQRRPLSIRALDAATKTALEDAAAPDHRVVWFEGARGRWRMTWLAVRSAKIRLTIPEAYAVHREIIEWGARYSDERVPDQALGADPLTLRFMQWAMRDWRRVNRMNRWFGGTLAPRLQLELVPGMRCAAHFALLARRPPRGIDDYVAAGAAVQRFWLAATASGLQLQPQHTPLVFAGYARDGVTFTGVRAAQQRAVQVAAQLGRLLGPAGAESAVFLGRLGHGDAPRARSRRLSIEQLRWVPPGNRPG